tara:strand:+ start:184 stop:507 length:324 start_codon:yes stop_codon:yes gene_type:complete
MRRGNKRGGGENDDCSVFLIGLNYILVSIANLKSLYHIIEYYNGSKKEREDLGGKKYEMSSWISFIINLMLATYIFMINPCSVLFLVMFFIYLIILFAIFYFIGKNI